MSDQDSQNQSNPGIVEKQLDEAPVEREGLQGGGVERDGVQRGDVEREGPQRGDVDRDSIQRGDVDREGMRGSPEVERERQDEGPSTEREGFGAADRDEQPTPQYDGSESQQPANRDEPDRGGGLS